MVHALAAATVALLTSAASQFAPTLVEHPIACSETIYLDGSDWIASNDNAIHRSLPATVPGDIITDLQRAGRVKDPYWNVTWRDPHFVEQWNNGTYTFTKQFPSPTSASAARCRAWLFCVPWPLHLPCGDATLLASTFIQLQACTLSLLVHSYSLRPISPQLPHLPSPYIYGPVYFLMPSLTSPKTKKAARQCLSLMAFEWVPRSRSTANSSGTFPISFYDTDTLSTTCCWLPAMIMCSK